MGFVNRNGRIKTLNWHLEQSARAQSVRKGAFSKRIRLQNQNVKNQKVCNIVSSESNFHFLTKAGRIKMSW